MRSEKVFYLRVGFTTKIKKVLFQVGPLGKVTLTTLVDRFQNFLYIKETIRRRPPDEPPMIGLISALPKLEFRLQNKKFFPRIPEIPLHPIHRIIRSGELDEEVFLEYTFKNQLYRGQRKNRKICNYNKNPNQIRNDIFLN